MSFPELDLVILKTLITNKKYAIDFANECDTKLFSPEVWNTANLVVGYTKTYKDIPTLRVITERLSKGGKNDKLIDHVKSVWEQIEKAQVNSSEYKYDLEKIKKRFAERQITSIKEEFSKLQPGSMDISKAVADMQKALQSIKGMDKVKTYECKSVKDYVSTFAEKYNAKKENPDFDRGLKTGYSFLDYASNGFKNADFLLVCGESGFGKSLFLQNIAIQIWQQDNNINDIDLFKNGKNIAYFSLEMPYEDCFNRFISRLSGVPSRHIENATLDKEQFAKIKKCLEFIKKYPYDFKIIDIADACSNDLETILNESNQKFDAIFVDYLGIMKPNEKSDEADWQKQGQISYELRAIARRLCLPMFSAVQLNRKTSGKGKESSENIGLHRLARSGTISTHCTHVVQIESRNGEDSYSDFLWHLIKCRKGPKGKGICYKNLSCATLIDKPIEIKDDKIVDQDDISKEIEKLII